MMARKLLMTAIMQATVDPVAPPPPLVISPSNYANNFGEFDAPQDVPFNAVVNYGTGPYTYLWEFINVNAGSGYVGAPTLLSGQGTDAVTIRFNGNTDATLRCTVTDNASAVQVASAVMLVHFGVVP